MSIAGFARSIAVVARGPVARPPRRSRRRDRDQGKEGGTGCGAASRWAAPVPYDVATPDAWDVASIVDVCHAGTEADGIVDALALVAEDAMMFEERRAER